MKHEDREAAQRPSKRVAYIIGAYPNLTTTFIDREVLEAKRLGLDITLVAIWRPQFDAFSSAVHELMDSTLYLMPVSASRLASAHIYFLATGFLRYIETLTYLLTREHPSCRSRFKTLLHFGGGVFAAALLRKKQIEHVHAHFADRAAVIAMVINRLLGVPYSVTAHAADIYRSPSFLQAKIARAKFAVTCTAFNKAHLEKATGYPIQLVYHGLDFAAIQNVRHTTTSTPSHRLILSVGRLQQKKGFSYLIRACARLRREGYDFRCEIIGEGPCKEALSTLIHELGLDDRVHLRGALPHAAVLLEYTKASVFVLPCTIADDGDRDGIPNVVLEAMAFGVPVISTNVSGIPEVVRDSDTGLLVKSGSVDELSAAVARLLSDAHRAAGLGRNGAIFVRREFDIRRNVGRLIELLNE